MSIRSTRHRIPPWLVVTLLVGLLHPAYPANGKRTSGLNVSGYTDLTFRFDSVRGSNAGRQTYTYGNFDRQRHFENRAGLVINGEIWPRFFVDATINNSRFSPDRSKYSLEYRGNGFGVTYGDINTAFRGNEFTPLYKSLWGYKVDARIGNLTLSSIISQERGQATVEGFQGTNTSGPYLLRNSPILDGSEQVRVDGQPKKIGVDYTIDYNTGIIWFQPTLIIPATSLIEVSYEYAGWGRTPGILGALRAETPIGKRGQIGATYITQRSKLRAGGDSNYRTERFIGDNTPMVLYLQYRPVRRVVRVMVDGVPQVENADFVVQSLDGGVIRFLKVVPAPPGALLGEAAANVVVEYEMYESRGQAGLRGDRSIAGLDGQWSFGQGSSLGLQFARSGGGPDRTGTALSLHGTTRLGALTLGLNFRDVGRRFSAIESVGFQQRERALNANLEFNASEHVRFMARVGTSARPTSSYLYNGMGSNYYQGGTSTTQDTSGTSETTLHATQSSVGVQLNFPKLPTLEIGHQRYRTSGGQLNSGSAMTDLRLQYSLGNAFSFTTNLQQTDNADRSSSGSKASSFTQRYSLAYTPGARFTLQADYSNSNLRSRYPSTTTGTTSTSSTAAQLVDNSNRASSAGLTVTYSPFSMATLTASYRLSDSGTGGYGGYGGFGGYGGYGGMNFGNSYYSSVYTGGGYLNSGNYSYGNQWTGDFYTPSYGGSGPSSIYGSGSNYTGGNGSGGFTWPGDWGWRTRWRYRHRAEGNADTTGTGADTSNTTATQNQRIRSISRSIGLQLTPMERLNLMLNYSHDLQEGQFTGSNSVSTNAQIGFTYSPTNLLMLNGSFSKQKYTFLGAGGNSGSSIALLGVQVGPVRRLTFHLNYHAMTSSTGLPSYAYWGGYGGYTGTGGYGTDYTGGYSGYGGYGGYGTNYTGPYGTNYTGTYGTGYPATYGTGALAGTGTAYRTRMNTLTGRIEYPIGQGRNRLFTELQLSRVRGGGSFGLDGGPENSSRLSAGLGIELALPRFLLPSNGELSWVFDLKHIRYTDTNNPQRNYRGNLVTGEMRARFN